MDQYIIVDNNNNIIDTFFTYQKDKIKIPAKILYQSDVSEIKHKINGKSISNEYGAYIFRWTGSVAVERSATEIEADFIQDYKKQKKEQLFQYIRDNLYDINRTLDQIRTQWASFKTNASSWTTVQQVDDAYDQAIVWLHS